MRIAIPQSLSQPLLLPWAQITRMDYDLVTYIAEALTNLINELEGDGNIHNLDITDRMSALAIELGAVASSSVQRPIVIGKKHYGVEVEVWFETKNDEFTWSAECWF